jgi:hypothetical protein
MPLDSRLDLDCVIHSCPLGNIARCSFSITVKPATAALPPSANTAEASASSLPAVAGGVGGGVLLIIVVIVVVAIALRRSNSVANHQQQDDSSMQMRSVTAGPVTSFVNPLYRSQAQQQQQQAEAQDNYDNVLKPATGSNQDTAGLYFEPPTQHSVRANPIYSGSSNAKYVCARLF